MAEAFLGIAILGLIESTLRITARLRTVTNDLNDSDRGLHRLTEELEILTEVLHECEETFTAATSAPASIARCMKLCISRHNELMEIVMRDIVQAKTKFTMIRRIKYVARQEQRNFAYNSFRDSILLLRDLASELRTKQQLVQISATMAEVLADDLEDLDSSTNASQGQGSHDRNGNNQDPDNNWTSDTIPSPNRNNIGHQKRALRDFAELARGNFVRDVVINVDTGKSGPNRFVQVPAREKSDTASDLNLIDMGLLEKAGIDMSLMKPAPIAINGIVDGVTMTPEFQVELSWYIPKGMKSSMDMFFVIRNATFDVLISSSKVAQNLRASTMITTGRRKTKEELRTEKEGRNRLLKEARELEEAQIEAAKVARVARDQALQGTNQAATTINQNP